MHSVPIVSVVMSVYNGERHVEEAIESILDQTFTDFEFIIINDGSTDATAYILSGYDDPRIRVVAHLNRGLTRSLNRALTLCRGRYIARMDADDIALPGRFARQVRELDARPRLGVLGTAVSVIDDRGWFVPEDGQIKTVTGAWNTAECLLLDGRNPLVHSSVMMRYDILGKVGGYREAFEFGQDFDLWLRMTEHCNIDNLPRVLNHRRASVGSTTAMAVLRHQQYHDMAIRSARNRRAGKSELLVANLPTCPRERAMGHVNNAKLHLRMDEFSEALVEARRALTCDWQYGPAWGLLAMLLPGKRFASWTRRAVKTLKQKGAT